MRCSFSGFSAASLFCFSLVILSGGQVSVAQGVPANLVAELPDAPRPQVDSIEPLFASVVPSREAGQQAQASASAAQGGTSSSAQQSTPAQSTSKELSVHDQAEQEIKEQEKQRVVGVVPEFNTSYRPDAAPLSVAQKFNVSLHTVSDPETFGVAFILTGGWHELFDGDQVEVKGTNTYIRENGTGFGWGPSGYFERVGAGYLDAFDSNILGNALFPSLFHQDPRFFRLGHGPIVKRTLYAVSTSFIAKTDHTRKWGPNYGNLLGNLVAGEISNFYYPSGDPTAFQVTLNTAWIQTAEGSLGAIFQEFWPDISRKVLHKDPTRGIDAELAKIRAEQDAAKQDAAKKAKQ